MIKVLYFASVREAVGESAEQFDLPAGIRTIGQLQQYLAARGGAWQALTGTKNLRMAVNQKMVAPDAPLREGDEAAFFPPVTGG